MKLGIETRTDAKILAKCAGMLERILELENYNFGGMSKRNHKKYCKTIKPGG